LDLTLSEQEPDSRAPATLVHENWTPSLL